MKKISQNYYTPYQLKVPVEIEKIIDISDYDKLSGYIGKLKTYADHIKICREERNSYSKTDHDATFMRMKKDYMGNDRLLPWYNIQLGVCDE